ncbi:MAG TPA: helix-turn-helix transcriptional regulator [Stellaceae bacterium]|nr:helix-turn-helix transcriptional regulator [Stellaceae bacterium]
MTLSTRVLASGPGWQVSDVVCTAGPRDPPFEESHGAVCIAAVLQGAFHYRSRQGAAMLAPGALLLGNAGECFECGHEHGTGDRCLAFHFAPDHLAEIVAAVPAARRTTFASPRLPPSTRLLPLLASAETARDERDGAALEELAFRVGGAVVAALAEGDKTVRPPSARDQRRIAEALRRIAERDQEPLAIAALAREAAMSPYHFLRVFRHVVGMTPHQYILRMRLHRAALRLRQTDQSVLAVALDAGFDDLSTFNRRFKRVMGTTPSAFRRAGGKELAQTPVKS